MRTTWTVRNQESDGVHVLGRRSTYAKALQCANEWDENIEWQCATQGVGSFGGRITIERTGGEATPADLEAMAAADRACRPAPVVEEEASVPCGQCGRATLAGMPFAMCYECQCAAHAVGEIDMDETDGLGDVRPPHDGFDEPEEAEAFERSMLPQPAFVPPVVMNCDDIPF